jgi:hypothetical protein
VAFLATLFIKELPLRDTAFADEDAGKEMLRSANQSAPEGADGLGRATNGTVKEKLLLTGLSLEYLAYKIENSNDDCPDLVAAASALAPAEPNAPGPPHARARLYAREVVRPLALQMMLATRGAGAGLASR